MPRLSPLVCALALSCLPPAAARAQELATPITSGRSAPAELPTTIGTGQHALVITSPPAAFKAGIPLIAPEALLTIDFSKNVLVLAVAPKAVSTTATLSISAANRGDALDLTVMAEAYPQGPQRQLETRPFALVRIPRPQRPVVVRLRRKALEEASSGSAFALVRLRQRDRVRKQVSQLEVDGDGAASLRVAGEEFAGQLTADELADVRRGVRAAQAATLPPKLPNAAQGGLFARQFELVVDGNQPQTRGNVSGDVHDYGAYAERLRPLMHALTAIEQRIRRSPSPKPTTLGPSPIPEAVRVQGVLALQDGELALDNGHHEILVRPAETAKLLRRFVGQAAELEGLQVTGNSLTVTRIVSPTRQVVPGIALIGPEGPVIGGSPVHTTFGPRRGLLTRFKGRAVRVDGWVFADHLVYPLSIQADATAAGLVRRAARAVSIPVGRYSRGDAVQIVETRGDWARVERKGGNAGWVRLRKLDLGHLSTPKLNKHGIVDHLD